MIYKISFGAILVQSFLLISINLGKIYKKWDKKESILEWEILSYWLFFYVKNCKNKLKNMANIILNIIEKSISLECLHTNHSCME